jgi:hypothetical protein
LFAHEMITVLDIVIARHGAGVLDVAGFWIYMRLAILRAF